MGESQWHQCHECGKPAVHVWTSVGFCEDPECMAHRWRQRTLKAEAGDRIAQCVIIDHEHTDWCLCLRCRES